MNSQPVTWEEVNLCLMVMRRFGKRCVALAPNQSQETTPSLETGCAPTNFGTSVSALVREGKGETGKTLLRSFTLSDKGHLTEVK